jgi:16S rRNA (cytidine1402-2'-O)-methyltransferase
VDPRTADDSRQAHGPHEEKAASKLFRIDPDLTPGLYVVSTPIGNLRDITLRALDILASCDVVCAEDTRVAGKLLSAFGVSARVRPYHDHNGAHARPGLLDELQGGARIALISDAGTPLVSDPGFKFVREAAQRGINVIAIPGASAPLAALASSGLPTDRFTFAGFPPPRSAARRRFLTDLKSISGTLIFFEGPSRLVASLKDMSETLGVRDAVVARELTKKFEELRRGTIAELAAHYAEAGPPRGEIVVLVGPGESIEAPDADALDAAILAAGEERHIKEIAAEIAERFGMKRRDVYERALALRRDEPGEPSDDDEG